MPRQNIITKRQSNALRLEALQRYFDFSSGRPTAVSIARDMNLSVDTVESWLTDPDNARFLDEIIPLWPNIGSAREFASKQVEAILRRVADIALGKHPQARAADELRAGEFLLAIAGVRASDVASQEPFKEILSAPVNVNVVIGAMPASYPDVIDGEARVIEG